MGSPEPPCFPWRKPPPRAPHPVRLARVVPAWHTCGHITACDHARVSLTTYPASPQPRSYRSRHAAYVATKPPESVGNPSLCPKLMRPACVPEAKMPTLHTTSRRLAPQASSDRMVNMLIIDGITETDLTLDDVENALCRRPKSCRPASPHDWLQRERDER